MKPDDLSFRLRAPRAAAGWSILVPREPLLGAWHVPPAWLDALQDDLDESGRREVSRFMLGGIHSASAHAERRFAAAARSQAEPPHQEHLLHLVSDEERHARAFAGFAEQACGGLLRDRVVDLGTPRGGRAASEALLFGRLLVTEEIIDALDLAIAGDPAVHPRVRALHEAHHADEARHLAFGRIVVPELVIACERAEGAAAAEGVRRELAQTVRATWRAAFPAEPFARAGMPSPVASRDAAWAAGPLASLRRRVAQQRLLSLTARGVLLGDTCGTSTRDGGVA